MELRIEHIQSDDLAAPGGHYAQGTGWGDLMFVSGQLPVSKAGAATKEDFEAQARVALANMLSVVESGGGSPETILKVNAYIVDVANWPLFDRVFSELLGAARPARTVIPVQALHYGFLIEVDAVAARLPHVRSQG